MALLLYIWRSSRNMNFSKIWRLWLKNCACHAISILNFSKAWQSYWDMPLKFWSLMDILSTKKWCFILFFFVSSTSKLKFEKSFFFFFRIAPKWYKKSWLWTIIYHLGATPEKKKQFFSNFSFPVEDTEKWIKHHFFVYKKSISDQNFKGISQKIGLPRPWEVQNWNGRGGHSFWATTFKFWENSYFLKIFKW